MNANLTTYTISFCFIILTSTALLYFSWKEVLTYRQWAYIGLGIFISFITYAFVETGFQINKKLTFEVSSDVTLCTQIDEDTTITKEKLYDYLKNTRISNHKIIYCQALIESGYFKSDLYKKNNNLFGMKLPKNRITSGSGVCGTYQKYNNWRESVSDYMLWMVQNNASELDESSYLKLLGKIYAEDTKYVQKIEKLLKESNFER